MAWGLTQSGFSRWLAGLMAALLIGTVIVAAVLWISLSVFVMGWKNFRH